MLALELTLLLTAIFGSGFITGFAIRAYMSYLRRKRARDQDGNSFVTQIGPLSDVPFISAAMRDISVDTNQRRLRRTSTAQNQ
jgi:hypothetical protein